jgi:hypothetical protein
MTTTPENQRLADPLQCTGGCSMRMLVTFILTTLMGIGFFGAFAAAEEVDPCGKSTGDVAIAACSRLININPRNVFALVSRGIAYKDKGDLDHAISDYSDAIRSTQNMLPLSTTAAVPTAPNETLTTR